MSDGRRAHPLETMDDITEVSSTEEVERKNTIMVTKNTEARSKTLVSAILGGVVGVVLMLIIGPLLGWTVGAVFIPIGALAGPFLFVGTVKDRTQQVRWKRLFNKLRSRSIEGEVFYPNSNHPEDITDLKELFIR